MNNPAAQAAVLPFQILESEGIPCGYERSAKLVPGDVLANRYLLGINLADITPAQLQRICEQLQMPASLKQPFLSGLPNANLIFIGFEADSRGGALYKLYLEYWEQLRQTPGFPDIDQARFLLHRGFKWDIDAPERQATTDYHFIPGLSIPRIRERIQAEQAGLTAASLKRPIAEMIALAEQRSKDRRLIYVEVSEPGNPRLSFDLNLYPADLRVEDIRPQLQQLARDLQIEAGKLDKLLQLTGECPLGHISAGTTRDDQAYFTYYYESQV